MSDKMQPSGLKTIGVSGIPLQIYPAKDGMVTLHARNEPLMIVLEKEAKAHFEHSFAVGQKYGHQTSGGFKLDIGNGTPDPKQRTEAIDTNPHHPSGEQIDDFLQTVTQKYPNAEAIVAEVNNIKRAALHAHKPGRSAVNNANNSPARG